MLKLVIYNFVKLKFENFQHWKLNCSWLWIDFAFRILFSELYKNQYILRNLNFPYEACFDYSQFFLPSKSWQMASRWSVIPNKITLILDLLSPFSHFKIYPYYLKEKKCVFWWSRTAKKERQNQHFWFIRGKFVDPIPQPLEERFFIPKQTFNQTIPVKVNCGRKLILYFEQA